jgi:hypothetical protein
MTPARNPAPFPSVITSIEDRLTADAIALRLQENYKTTLY